MYIKYKTMSDGYNKEVTIESLNKKILTDLKTSESNFSIRNSDLFLASNYMMMAYIENGYMTYNFITNAIKITLQEYVKNKFRLFYEKPENAQYNGSKFEYNTVNTDEFWEEFWNKWTLFCKNLESLETLGKYADGFEFNLPADVIKNVRHRDIISKNMEKMEQQTNLAKKLEQMREQMRQQMREGGGDYLPTASRIKLNGGTQNRIVYKKNGKGEGYIKMRGEFIKLKDYQKKMAKMQK
jgi:hypothetical protein